MDYIAQLTQHSTSAWFTVLLFIEHSLGKTKYGSVMGLAINLLGRIFVFVSSKFNKGE
jgi:hypothetical protein